MVSERYFCTKLALVDTWCEVKVCIERLQLSADFNTHVPPTFSIPPGIWDARIEQWMFYKRFRLKSTAARPSASAVTEQVAHSSQLMSESVIPVLLCIESIAFLHESNLPNLITRKVFLPPELFGAFP